jgi:hypothetical protein
MLASPNRNDQTNWQTNLDLFKSKLKNSGVILLKEYVAMKLLWVAVLVTFFGITAKAVEFAKPVRMEGGGEPVRVERPGYASPCWADIDGDGKKDLLVGQFSGGKIRFFKNRGDAKLDAGDWLKADGKVAEVPGVW